MTRDPIDLASRSYTPVRLINSTAATLGCKNDTALAYALEMDLAQLSRIRHRLAPVTEFFLVQIMDRTGQHIQEVRALAGIPFDGEKALVVITQSTALRFPKNLLASIRGAA